MDAVLDTTEAVISLGVRELACRLNQNARNIEKTAENLARIAHIHVSGETLRQLLSPGRERAQGAARGMWQRGWRWQGVGETTAAPRASAAEHNRTALPPRDPHPLHTQPPRPVGHLVTGAHLMILSPPARSARFPIQRPENDTYRLPCRTRCARGAFLHVETALTWAFVASVAQPTAPAARLTDVSPRAAALLSRCAA